MLGANEGIPVMKPGAFIVKHRLRAFPCAAGAKAPWPGFVNNLNRATADLPTLRYWSKIYRGCNWGASLALSGLLVMDVDDKPGKVGAATLARLIGLHGSLPRTLTVRTPSGGRHFYFKQTNTVRFLTGSQNTFGTDIDCPGYVVIPGSVLRDPEQYPGPYVVEDDAPIAYAPDWFAIYLQQAERESVEQEPVVELDQTGNIAWAIDHLKHYAEPAIQGRNGERTLLMVAAVLKDHGISRELAVDLLAEFYNDRCEPQWSIEDGATADRLDVKVHNAYQYLKHVKPGAATAEADFGDDIEPPWTEPQPHPSAVKARADKYVNDHYTVVNGTLYPKRKARRARR